MRFAHLADCHLGAWRDRTLRKLNILAFEQAMDKAIRNDVDFIVIAGDLFHTNVPDMDVVKRSVEKMWEAKEKGIEIYLQTGSHDYHPSMASIADVLESTRFLVKLGDDEDTLGTCFQDVKTGAKLFGIPGRKAGRELDLFESADTRPLEAESGFKIFVFHTAISEICPQIYPGSPSVPLDLFPRGMSYYAGGHPHKKIPCESRPGYGKIAYPGTLFGYSYRDLDVTADGEKRGFYIVDFNEQRVEDVQFIEVHVVDIISQMIDITGQSVDEAEATISKKIEDLDIDLKVVLLRLKGTLSSGEPYEVDRNRVRQECYDRRARTVNINIEQLRSASMSRLGTILKEDFDQAALEQAVLKEQLIAYTGDLIPLQGESGLSFAQKLLAILRQERVDEGPDRQTKKDYTERLMKEAMQLVEEEIL